MKNQRKGRKNFANVIPLQYIVLAQNKRTNVRIACL